MSINNLHSLFSGKWFIDEAYSKSLLPSLNLILKGQIPSGNKTDITDFALVSTTSGEILSNSALENPEFNEDFVAVLDIKSPIYKYSQDCGPQGTKAKTRSLERYRLNDNCVGVVLDIDSGGGQVSGTPEFHDYIKAYSKPIVAYTDGMMCSAAYYIGAATNHIIANKRADYIGSIGTMISFIDMSGFYKKKGAKIITEYATKSTKKNRNYEDLIAGNPENYIKNELDPINETFHADIKNTRPNIDSELFTGETWNAESSLNLGLVDQLGTLQDAVSKVLELSNTNKSKKQENMSKTRAKTQAVLGLDSPLAATDNGSYLNENQLDAIEAHLETQETANATLTQQLADANANTETADQLAIANTAISGTTTSVDAMLEQSGLEVTGTLDEKLEALSAKVTTMSKQDGAKPTVIKTDATQGASEKVTEVMGMDITGASNY